jgi:hypothetical protein
MSLGSMRQELLGIPGCNFGLVTTKINEALAAVQDENVFSFQLRVGGWLTPGLLGGPNTTFLSPGAMTVSPFSNTVTGDAVASATWKAANQSSQPLTTQQIRVPYYSLYNIVAVGNNGTVSWITVQSAGSGQTPGTYSVPVTDSTGPGTGGMVSITVGSDGTVTATPVVLAAGSGYQSPVINFSEGGVPASFAVGLQVTLTLDRPWMEPSQTNADYMIYQAYFPAPLGFRRWYYILDTTNNNYMDWWSYTQSSLAEEEDDAQRINFLQPTNVVPWGIDNRTGSATLGQMLYELWPHPIMQLPYTFGCQALWPALQSPGDTLPYPLTDELIKLRSYEMIYLWKESQKGDEMERGSGANWQFLAQAMRGEYENRLKRIRIADRNLVDLYFTKMRRAPQSQQVWGTVTGQANVGGWDS